MNMLDIIDDVRLSCLQDRLGAEKKIPLWREQFRQRGISILTLETLLNFYLFPSASQQYRGLSPFITQSNPYLDAALVDENAKLRRQIETLCHQIDKLNKK